MERKISSYKHFILSSFFFLLYFSLLNIDLNPLKCFHLTSICVHHDISMWVFIFFFCSFSLQITPYHVVCMLHVNFIFIFFFLLFSLEITYTRNASNVWADGWTVDEVRVLLHAWTWNEVNNHRCCILIFFMSPFLRILNFFSLRLSSTLVKKDTTNHRFMFQFFFFSSSSPFIHFNVEGWKKKWEIRIHLSISYFRSSHCMKIILIFYLLLAEKLSPLFFLCSYSFFFHFVYLFSLICIKFCIFIFFFPLCRLSKQKLKRLWKKKNSPSIFFYFVWLYFFFIFLVKNYFRFSCNVCYLLFGVWENFFFISFWWMKSN